MHPSNDTQTTSMADRRMQRQLFDIDGDRRQATPDVGYPLDGLRVRDTCFLGHCFRQRATVLLRGRVWVTPPEHHVACSVDIELPPAVLRARKGVLHR